jgi:hypothetical protein
MSDFIYNHAKHLIITFCYIFYYFLEFLIICLSMRLLKNYLIFLKKKSWVRIDSSGVTWEKSYKIEW